MRILTVTTVIKKFHSKSCDKCSMFSIVLHSPKGLWIGFIILRFIDEQAEDGRKKYPAQASWL